MFLDSVWHLMVSDQSMPLKVRVVDTVMVMVMSSEFGICGPTPFPFFRGSLGTFYPILTPPSPHTLFPSSVLIASYSLPQSCYSSIPC
jgi:hypothetical protein